MAHRLALKGGPVELEQLDSADTPLAVHHLAVVANFVAMALSKPPSWIVYSPLPPLFLLMFTGLYMFVLPYMAKWRGGRRRLA